MFQIYTGFEPCFFYTCMNKNIHMGSRKRSEISLWTHGWRNKLSNTLADPAYMEYIAENGVCHETYPERRSRPDNRCPRLHIALRIFFGFDSKLRFSTNSQVWRKCRDLRVEIDFSKVGLPGSKILHRVRPAILLRSIPSQRPNFAKSELEPKPIN